MVNSLMTTIAILVAAGRGTRAQANGPKQWEYVAGARVADWTLARFASHPAIDQIVFVHHRDDTPQLATLKHEAVAVVGGLTRAASVEAGLHAAQDLGATHVMIHDVARCCVSSDLITRCAEALKTGPVAPALAVTDALWIGDGAQVTGTQSREGLWRAQTPQCFALNDILTAHQTRDAMAADDVAVARSAGLEVAIIEGEEQNIKITTPADFARAAQYLRDDMDIRLGNGYDVHAFGPGDHVVLCGVKIPHDAGLIGHSDADVAMHTVTDAIYGALAEGDIGRHFPPSDPQWKGAESNIFLSHAVDLAAKKGYKISNVDCTIVCEDPKITPHSSAMVEQMEHFMKLAPGRVSVKATTSERLGFTGRREGIAAIATVALVSG